jgi:hypothetical protein
MAERECGYLAIARTKVCIVADAEGVGLLLHGSNKAAFDFGFGSSRDDEHLQPETAHRGL